jgi:hypothetical protein
MARVEPIRPLAGAADYDPVIARAAAARVVCLGEASHGTHEFYRERAEITKRLIQPGRFNPFGAVAAVYFLATGITGLQQLGVDTFVQQLFYGGALVLAVALSQLVRRRRAIELGPTEG